MTYVMSDIHGCLNELKAALEHIDLSAGGRLVLLGDYIDYGPQSGETLRCVYELQRQHGAKKVIVLRGNHEDAFLEWLSTYSGPNASQPDEYGMIPWNDWLDHDEGFNTFRTLITPEQWAFFQKVLPTLSEDTRNMEAARMVLAADPELIAWLRGLPYHYETPRQIFVHAGIGEETGEWWPWATPEYVFVGKYPAETGQFYKDIIAGHVGASGLAGNLAYHGVWWDGQNHYYIDGSIQLDGRLNILAWDEEQGYRQWDDDWKEVLSVSDLSAFGGDNAEATEGIDCGGQIGAVVEGISSKLGDTGGNEHAGQAFAVLKGTGSDFGHAVGDDHVSAAAIVLGQHTVFDNEVAVRRESRGGQQGQAHHQGQEQGQTSFFM